LARLAAFHHFLPKLAMTTFPPSPSCTFAITRRTLLLASAPLLLLPGAGPAGAQPASAQQAFSDQLTALQARIGGRIGVQALDTQTRRQLAFNADQRFAMCSVFKMLLSSAVLAEADAGRLSLEQRVRYSQRDMVAHSPVTEVHLAEGAMSVRALCAAVMEVSDNPAANLLLPLVGGPAGLTRYLRTLGDTVTRCDRTETSLNSNLPGDPRDTSTPAALVQTMERLLVGDALKPASRAQLLDWMINCQTGLQRLRGGLPGDWKAGDKTGTGQNGAATDALIAWPPGRGPVLMTVLLSESTAPLKQLNAAHAEVARLAVQALAA
jgi:beta-lactamase class A